MKKRSFLKKAGASILTLAIMMCVAVPALAAQEESDPLTIISNLDDIIFGVIKGIGIGFAAFGFFQIGTSIPSHDAGQRAIGIASLVGALLMIFAKQLLKSIGGL